jgi:hypothetical protein
MKDVLGSGMLIGQFSENVRDHWAAGRNQSNHAPNNNVLLGK